MKDRKLNYTSTYEFIQDVQWVNGKAWPNCKKDSHTGRFNFCQSKDWDESVEQTYTGVAMEEVENIREEVLEGIMRQKQTTVYDVVGDHVDVGRFVSGEPECMVDFRMEDVKQDYLHIAINVCEAGATSGDFLKKKAAVIAAAVDKMEHAQTHRCKISVCMVNTLYESKPSVLEIVIKDYNQPMNVAEISGSLAVGFFRRIIFAWIEKYAPKAASRGYGRVNSWDDVDDVATALQVSQAEADGSLLLIENSRDHSEFGQKLSRASGIKELSECANLLIKKASEIKKK